MLTEELARVGATAEGDVFDGLSDYDPFIRAGIPTGGVFAGGLAGLQERFAS